MISQISGILIKKQPPHVMIDVKGIGFEIEVPMSTYYGLPKIGEFVIGEKQPYEYLVKSIKKFINQKQLIEIMYKNKFKNCEFRNLTGGIVAIHSGWKL